MTALEVPRSWIPLRASADPDAMPLFCLPHAGGAASAFRIWVGHLPGVDVLPVQPPGREARLREPPYLQMTPLVEELATVVGDVAAARPYALYGHSLGALVAFETARELRRRGQWLPVHLIVSGSAAPQCAADHGPRVSRMPEPELVRKLRKLGGTPEWLLNDPEARQMILPAIRADFAVREAYDYDVEPPLSTPITVLSSSDDPQAPHRLQARWIEQTSGPFRIYTLQGGHFAVFEQDDLVPRYLIETLRSGAVPL